MHNRESRRSSSFSEDRYNALARNTFDGFWYRAEVLSTSSVSMMHTIRSWSGTKLAHFDDVILYDGRHAPENWQPMQGDYCLVEYSRYDLNECAFLPCIVKETYEDCATVVYEHNAGGVTAENIAFVTSLDTMVCITKRQYNSIRAHIVRASKRLVRSRVLALKAQEARLSTCIIKCMTRDDPRRCVLWWPDGEQSMSRLPFLVELPSERATVPDECLKVACSSEAGQLVHDQNREPIRRGDAVVALCPESEVRQYFMSRVYTVHPNDGTVELLIDGDQRVILSAKECIWLSLEQYRVLRNAHSACRSRTSSLSVPSDAAGNFEKLDSEHRTADPDLFSVNSKGENDFDLSSQQPNGSLVSMQANGIKIRLTPCSSNCSDTYVHENISDSPNE